MKIKRELKIGIYFTVILVGLIWGISFLKGLDLFSKTDRFYAVYENVEGLQTTSPVYIKGMKVGTVSKIELELEQNEKFIVEIKIKSNYQIPSNSTAYIYSADIMGSKSIKIKIGNSSSFLKDGDRIDSGHEGDMFSVFMEDLPSVKDSLKTVLKKVDLVFTGINRLLSDENIDNLTKSIASLENTLQNFSQLSNTLNKSKTTIAASLENFEAITGELRNNGENISSLIKNLAAFSDTLKSLQLTQIAYGFNNILEKVNSGSGSAGKIIYGDSLYNNLANSLNNLDSLLVDIRKHPKRYINISVFGKK